MQTKTIIQLRNIFILIAGIIVFFGCQVVPSGKTNELHSLGEAFIMFLFITVPQYILWSEYVYGTILDEGINLNYKLYQYIGLIVAIGFFILMVNAYSPQ